MRFRTERRNLEQTSFRAKMVRFVNNYHTAESQSDCRDFKMEMIKGDTLIN